MEELEKIEHSKESSYNVKLGPCTLRTYISEIAEKEKSSITHRSIEFNGRYLDFATHTLKSPENSHTDFKFIYASKQTQTEFNYHSPITLETLALGTLTTLGLITLLTAGIIRFKKRKNLT